MYSGDCTCMSEIFIPITCNIVKLKNFISWNILYADHVYHVCILYYFSQYCINFVQKTLYEINWGRG